MRGRRKIRQQHVRSAAAVLFLFLLDANASGVSAGAWPAATYYTVVARPDETLVALSRRYRVPAEAVARLNRLPAQSELKPGEVLRIPAGSSETRKAVLADALDPHAWNYAAPPRSFGTRTVETQNAVIAHPWKNSPRMSPSVNLPAGEAADRPLWFAWPVRGNVIARFGPAGDGERNDGINIAAEAGMPIRAAAAGTVTYAGDGLKDYGNLVLIAHLGGYVSAYAHAQRLLVSPGERVEMGEVIATAGETGGVDRPQLHFEIRAGVKPLNPLPLLAANR